jgi:hypothetical protein
MRVQYVRKIRGKDSVKGRWKNSVLGKEFLVGIESDKFARNEA